MSIMGQPKRQVWWGEAQSLLKEEIAELEKELEAQTMERSVLEKALFNVEEDSVQELIREIAHLEAEVVYLEKYLLSLYRKCFAKRLSTAPPTEDPMIIDSGIYRSHSSLSASSFRASSPQFGEAVDAYHSLPLSMFMLERTQNAGVTETPNWLSEEMIKCISTVYSHLSEPNNPGYELVEIRSIARDPGRLKSVEDLLASYRSLISRLGQVDPWKLSHQEKLAFWINLHNALVMHAFVVYGVPRASLKKVSLVLKAAYNIGGHTVSVDTIQSCILRCRLPRPTLWLPSFLRKTKFKAGGDPRALKYLEPRLRFALCSGCQSDPPVRLYTAKRVFQELEIAKEEYFQMNIKVHKDQRLVMPKNVEYFTKEMGLSPSAIAEMLDHAMPGRFFQQRKVRKVEWIAHNFAFRFLLANELIRMRDES